MKGTYAEAKLTNDTTDGKDNMEKKTRREVLTLIRHITSKVRIFST